MFFLNEMYWNIISTPPADPPTRKFNPVPIPSKIPPTKALDNKSFYNYIWIGKKPINNDCSNTEYIL